MTQSFDANRGIDPTRSRLRATLATMEREIAPLRKGAHEALIASFDDLVAQLALGAEPEVRDCPTCGGVCMRLATVCAGCWTKLTPAQ